MVGKLREAITEFFVNSHDFNGLHLFKLSHFAKVPEPKIRAGIEQLLRDNEIDLAFESISQNPHIKRIEDLPVEKQIEKLRNEPLIGICAYPKAHLVEQQIDLSNYNDRPYTKRLWQVEPQLTPVYFDLAVLERYFRDARYEFEFNDLQGSISVRGKHYDDSSITEKDRVFLQTFGIGYDDSRNRVVVAYLRYLSNLSPEHQQYWQTFLCHKKCTSNSDYHNASILGAWPEHISVYAAFLREQIEINRICELIERPPLFLKTYEEKRPMGFHAMINPTKKSFDDFVHLLDKLISDNINQKFFGDDIEFENIKEHDDGTIERQRMGTLQLLENWLSKFFKVPDKPNAVKDNLSSFRELRKLRQTPAHKIEDDEYDIEYTKRQDELVEKVYHTLMWLRLVFSKHPMAHSYKPPEWLREDKIVFY